MKLFKLDKKNSCVQLLLTCFCTLISFNCNSQSNTNDSISNSDIRKWGNFEIVNNLPLPFTIEKYKDFEKYSVKLLSDVNGKWVLVDNLRFKIFQLEKKLFKNIYPISKDFYYQFVYKKSLKGLLLLLIIQTNEQTGDYFFYINSFNASGEIIDHLKIAGQKIDDYDRFCNIDINGNIQIRTIKFDMPTNDGLTNGVESDEQYIIDPKGYFKKIKETQKKGLFDIKDDKIIRVG